MKRVPIRILLAIEIDQGLVNQDKLEMKVAAFLEMINSKMDAFDPKTGEKVRTKFDDALIVHINKDKKKVPIKIISPRLENGRYVAFNAIFGCYDNFGKPNFGTLKGLVHG